MQTLRKILAISVIFVTVLSLSVVVAPQAKAAASAGDLVKMNGLSSVYYLGADGKRYVFPNEATYFSWYSDFSSVVTVPQAELEAMPLGKNVTIRPGTKLVKITTNPNVYAVTTGGTLLRVPDESTAKALYGDNWAKRVVDVADAFFTNYTISSSAVSSSAYPAGSLIKTATSPDVYYIDATGAARKVASETAFTANRFKFSDIITTTLTIPTAGTDITAGESTLTDTSSGAGGTIPTGGSGLTVALSGDTPAVASVPSKSTLVPWLSVNLTASNDGAVVVNDMTFTRTGTGAATDFSGGYLYIGDIRLTSKRTVSTADNKITFSTIGLTVPAGTTKTVTLKMNANTTSNVQGNHAFKIAAASDIVTGGATVSGSFPVQGNTLSYSTVNAASVTVTGDSASGNKKVGETNAILGEFTLANNSSLEDVNITRIRLKQNGTAANSATANYSLTIDGTKVAEGVQMVDKYVDFKLATPFLLKQAKTVTATVRGDVVSDVNKTVQLFLNDAADLEAQGTAYGNFYDAAVTNSLTTSNASSYTIKGSAITVSYDGPNAADVKQNTKNYVFANLLIKAENEDVTIDTLPFTLVTSEASSTATLDNVKLVDSTNGLTYGVASDPAGADTSETLTFENVVLKKGVQYKFAVTGDIPNNVNAGMTYRVDWAASGVVAKYVTSDVSVAASDFSASSLTGKTFTVAAAKITFTTAPVNAATYVKSAQKVLLYKFTAAANSVDNLKLSKIKVATSTGSTVLTSIDQAFDKLELYKVDSAGAETLLDDETSLSGSSATFSGFTVDVPKGANNAVTFVVRGNVKSSPTAGTISLKGSTTKSDYTVRDSDSASVTDANIVITSFTVGHVSTIATQGTYTAVFDSTETGTNANQNVLAGTKALVGRIKLTAAKEKALFKKISIVESGSMTGADVPTLALYRDKAGTQLVATAAYDSTNYNFDLTATPFEVNNVGATYLYVFANVNGVDYSDSPAPTATASAGKVITLALQNDGGSNATEVTGKDTGATLADGVTGTTSKNSTVMGAVVSNISTSFADAVLSNGAKDVFSFKVTAPASSNTAYDGTPLGANVGTTTFTVASSSGITLGTFKVRRIGGADGEQTAGGNAVQTGSSLQIDFQAIYQGKTDGIVRPGETAEFVVTATVGGVSGTGNSLAVSLETVDTNFNYYHTTTGAALFTAQVKPLIPGLSSVRGGVLKQ